MKLGKIVIKLGTNVVTQDQTLVAWDRLSEVSRFIALARSRGVGVLTVSSGAVGLGRRKLGLKKKPDLSQKQACAAVGQSLLMRAWQKVFEEYEMTAAQVLVTAGDLSDRVRYLNLRETLETLLKWKVIPVLNENDSVSTAELREDSAKSFGDNDRLSAIVASKIEADLLVILSDVDGVYTANPKLDKDAKKIPLISDLEQLGEISKEGQSDLGRGGMAAKIEAARIAAISGVPVLITSGFSKGRLDKILSVENLVDLGEIGTLIQPKTRMHGKKKWIGLASGYSGVLVLNDGAVQAIVKKKASLLPGGIVDVRGVFNSGEVVSLHNEAGNEIGRGICSFTAEDLRKILGKKSAEVRQLLGSAAPVEAIHRDFLVAFETEKEV